MDVAEEISSQIDMNFDLIATTLATGTTFSGLLIGGKSHLKSSKILGVSIAREKNQVMQIVQHYINSSPLTDKEKNELWSTLTDHILEDYTSGGYGKTTPELLLFIESTMRKTGIILDPVYTGKGLYGLVDYLTKNGTQYQNQRILFLYTGGFFNF
jgi:1-aminocyclopropane-1-carboxylate deaminase/D-cysteine desulfhydrase-like pyridoxal-dependent ACC family enzyme